MNGQNEISNNIDNDDYKNINMNDMNNQLSDLINNFRICLLKYGIKK